MLRLRPFCHHLRLLQRLFPNLCSGDFGLVQSITSHLYLHATHTFVQLYFCAESSKHTSTTASFVVDPGFIPTPPKLVQYIWVGQFVDLPILIQESCDRVMMNLPPVHSMLLDGQLIVNPGPRKTRNITDIVTWVQAFSVYASIFCAHHPPSSSRPMAIPTVHNSSGEAIPRPNMG